VAAIATAEALVDGVRAAAHVAAWCAHEHGCVAVPVL
jgi:hypothetical protein